MSTACHSIHDEASMQNPNVVKVVMDKQGNALYFSRALIPYHRHAMPQDGAPTKAVLRHIGIYAYRAGFLRAFGQLAPAIIEQSESLEQLRALWHGYKIGVAISPEAPPGGVDTEQDLQAARKKFAAGIY